MKPTIDTAYLQYTSGSTRRPAGVMMSHKNVLANFEQMMPATSRTRKRSPPDTTFVSWLPFYHDMGLILGILRPILRGSPPCSPVRWHSCSGPPGGCN